MPAAATVGVVVTTYNHAHFLEQALQSVRSQTRATDAVMVVDDGSTDNPAEVVSRFPNVSLIRQENRGLAAARNAGLAAIDASYVVFLDADDRLEPRAIEAGLACFARAPDSGFVYGGHRYIDVDGQEIGERFEPPGEQPYLHLLRGNFIGMHGSVMYRRDCLVAAGGFDERLRRCEDYDVYLRMARRYPVTGYPDLVAAYRLHGKNMSADHGAMLHSALDVHARHAPSAAEDLTAREAWAEGRRRWRRCYAEEMAAARYRDRQQGGTLSASLPELVGSRLPRRGWRFSRRSVASGAGSPRSCPAVCASGCSGVASASRRLVASGSEISTGSHRSASASGSIAACRSIAITSSGSSPDTRRRSSAACWKSATTPTPGSSADHASREAMSLHVHHGNPRATFVGDLTDPDVLPEAAFDCIVLTQTLQLIYDVPLAIARIHRALAPGGAVLVTAPGISQIDRGEWGKTWFWSFTPAALHALFSEVFGPEAVMVERYGNVFAATAFLQGLAVEELDTSDLDPIDQAYPVIVALRARKRV